MSKAKSTVIVGALLLGAGTLFFFQQQRLGDSTAANAALQRQLDQANSNLDAAAEQAKRLTEMQRVLEKRTEEVSALRGEVAKLRRTLTGGSNQLSRAKAAPPPAPAAKAVPAQTNLTFRGVTQTTLTPGQTLIVGGWSVEPGKRIVVLATPTVPPKGNGMIVMREVFLSLPEDILSGPGWESFQNLADGEAGIGLFEAGQARQFEAELKGTEGVTFTRAPRVTTLDGHEARITTGEQDSGQDLVSFEPVIAPDGSSVVLTVSNALFHPQLP